ncbi:hypothetical protein HW450_07770 [Corynebacterium hindlerae]|uniref:Uncharacterized protein n=1 Tax=Corynebacterium hindlerae TaxID=699041 RepID=A0A7G5FCD5_9CORY|nr:hypothetical protein [Corynebacterium hindlerae]QMV84276.1 hypothetical protein HW450_07770 [Corynebacterium hindlerae]
MIHLEPTEVFNPGQMTCDEYLDSLFNTFLKTLIHRPLYWKTAGCRVSFRRYEEVDGRYASFWHLISGGSQTDTERNVEIERCRRIGWIRPMVEAFNQDFPNRENHIYWWVSPDPRWRGRRYGLATEGFEYVLFIEERPKYALIITAYYVKQTRRRAKFRAEHDEFWKEKQGPPA